MRRVAFLVFSLLALVTLLPAQNAEISGSLRRTQVSGKDLGTFGFAEQPVRIENGWGFALRLDLNSNNFFAHELSYGLDRDKMTIGGQDQGKITVHQFYYDLLFHIVPRPSRIRPFVAAGLGFSSFFPPQNDVLNTGGITKFGWNYGAGLKVKVGGPIGLRLDIRDHVNNKPNILALPNVSGKLHQLELSAGISLLL